MARTHYLNLIDRSGSMGSRIHEVVAGYNLLNKNSLEDGQKAKVTLAIFDNEFEVLYSKVKLEEVKDISVDDVQPRGMTPLYDAIAKLLALGDPYKPTLVQVFSDGGENGSHEVSREAVQALCKQCEDKGWEIQFVGMDIDAKQAASGLDFRTASNKMSGTQSYVNTVTSSYADTGLGATMGPQGDVGKARSAYSKIGKMYKKANKKGENSTT